MPKLKTPSRTPERVPSQLRIASGDAGGIRLSAAQPIEGDKPPLRRFTMAAYTGGPMQLAGWRYPVVVDLAGLRIPKKSRPILKDHHAGQIVGHTDDMRVTDTVLEVAGVISGTGPTAQEIIATSENGFPWQASLGATAEKVVFIPEGRTATANAREFTGPVYVVRKSVLGEVSFVALGADDQTWAQVPAGAPQDGALEVYSMEFEQWATDKGLQLDNLAESNVTALRAMFAAEQSQVAPSPSQPESRPQPAAGTESAANDVAERIRASAASETRRIDAIRRVCSGQHSQIEAQAIEEGWDEVKTELAVLRATRPRGPAIHGAPPAPTAHRTHGDGDSIRHRTGPHRRGGSRALDLGVMRL